jgi:hypothetical protein
MAIEEQQQPDTSEPSERRKAEIRAAYQAGGDNPCKDVAIRTMGELYWGFDEHG